MARLRTRAEHRAARRAISHPVRPVACRAHSVSSLPPRPAARRARNASSAPTMALGAKKSPPSSGRKAESAPAGPLGPKSAPASPSASTSGPTFLGHRLCLRCAKFAESTPEHNCLFNKDSSKMYACCRALKSPCLPVSVPVFVTIWVLILLQIPSRLASTGRKLLRTQRELARPISVFRWETLRGKMVGTTTRLATVRSGPDRGLFWRLLKRPDCTVQSFVGLDWTVPKDRTVRR